MSRLLVRGLSKTYPGGITALDGVDLTVDSGLYGLLGPNGAGKSTLMRTIAALQDPDTGTLSFDGIDVLAQPRELRRRLGYLPQQVGAYPGVSARRLLERFAWLKGRTDRAERDRELDAVLARVNLVSEQRRAVSSYSGGMLRRFGIAMALLGNPSLLIVDEPTAGLDPVERVRFHRVLADVGEQAVVLLSTHIVEDVQNLCPRLAILAAGRIVAEGTPEDLVKSLEGRLWSTVLARAEPEPKDILRSAPRPDGERYIAVGSERPAEGWQPHVPQLEDVYHQALQKAEVAA